MPRPKGRGRDAPPRRSPGCAFPRRLTVRPVAGEFKDRHGCGTVDGRTTECGDDDESRGHESFRAAGAGPGVRSDPHLDREPGKDSVVVLRRDQEAGDHQLPDLQAGARRSVLRPHLRSDQGLRVLVRQVQAHEVQGHHLREVRRRGDAVASAARADGPYRARRSGGAHLVPEVAAEPHRPAARHDPEGSRADPVLRVLHGARARSDAPAEPPASV